MHASNVSSSGQAPGNSAETVVPPWFRAALEIIEERLRNEHAGTIVPELLTTAEAAALCGMGERSLYRFSRAGIAPAPVTVGPGTRRYRRSELLAWIAAGCPKVNGGRDHG